MDIINLLAGDNYVVINRDLIKEIGIKPALMLSELCSEYNYFEHEDMLVNGWFYSTIENVEDRVGLSKHEQSTAIRELERLDFLQYKVAGIPPTRHIFLNVKKLENQMSKNWKIKSKKIGKLKVKKLDTKNNNIKIINKKIINDFSANCIKDDYTDLYDN